MAYVIQIIDVNSDGWKIRLSDGSYVTAPHDGPTPHIGEEFSGAAEQQADSTGNPAETNQPEAPETAPRKLIRLMSPRRQTRAAAD